MFIGPDAKNAAALGCLEGKVLLGDGYHLGLEARGAELGMNVKKDTVPAFGIQDACDSPVGTLPDKEHILDPVMPDIRPDMPPAVVETIDLPAEFSAIVKEKNLTQELTDLPVVILVLESPH
jgi:hypothetical protein